MTLVEQIKQLETLRTTVARSKNVADVIMLWELFYDNKPLHDDLRFGHPEYHGHGLWYWYVLNMHEVEEDSFAAMFAEGLRVLIAELESTVPQPIDCDVPQPIDREIGEMNEDRRY